jgi:hypothetical protein
MRSSVASITRSLAQVLSVRGTTLVQVRSVSRFSKRQHNHELQSNYRFQTIEDAPRQREAATRLLCEKQYPIGSFTPESWFEAEELLPWWSIQRTTESVQLSFQLLDRFVAESRHEGALNSEIHQWLNVDALNSVLNNWRVVWWDNEDAVEDPMSVAKRVQGYYKSGLLPNEKSFYLLTEAAVTSGDKIMTPDFCEDLLEECIRMYETTGDADCLPNVDLFNLVIRSWAKSGRKEAPQRAEALLERMTDLDVPLNRRTYLRVIHTWALTGSREGALRAEELLTRMYTEFVHGDDRTRAKLRPDVTIFSTVISALAKSGVHDAGPRAEELLQTMRELRRSNVLQVYVSEAPAVNATMQCYANQKTIEGARRAEELFEEMKKSTEYQPR